MNRYVLDQVFHTTWIRDEEVLIDDRHGGTFRLERNRLALVQYNDVRVVDRFHEEKEALLVANDWRSSLPLDSPRELKQKTRCLDAESGAEIR